MRWLARLEYERKSGAVWYIIFRQSPKGGGTCRSALIRAELVDLS